METQYQGPIISCATCGTKQELLRCAKCKTIYYCSTAHQLLDWPSHKRKCHLLAKQKFHRPHNTMENYEPTNQPLSVILSNDDVNSQANLKQDKNKQTIEQMEDDNGVNENGLISNSMSKEGDNNLFTKHHPQSDLKHMNHMSQRHNEKCTSYHIGYGDENSIGYANDRRYEELCRHIIDDMNQYGLSVVDDFLGMEKGLQILNEVHRMYAAGVFQDGQLVNDVGMDRESRTIRGDKITWVKGVEPGCTSVGYLINQIDAVVCRSNSMKNNGKLGNYNIKERTKAMIACYPGSGSHYVMHVDNPNRDGRVITAIYYLNVNWDTKRSGGVLRIFPERGNAIADIEPKFDRLIFFWSDKRNPHEVQPAHRTRYAITVWYFDANEREVALNRCKYKNSDVNKSANEFNLSLKNEESVMDTNATGNIRVN